MSRALCGLLFVGIVTLVFSPCAAMIWLVSAPPVAREQAARMRNGMSKDDARLLLGPAGSMHTSDDGSEQWIYSRFTMWVFVVRFSPHGIVTSFGEKF